MLTTFLRFRLRTTIAYFSFLLFFGCIDPIAPEYNFVDGLIVIESLASSTAGASYVNVNKTSSEFGVFRNVFQEGAVVTFNNLDTGEIVVLQEQVETYVPPPDFAVTTGESWELNVTLADGEQYRSLAEKVVAPVPILDIKATFDEELLFRDASKKFVAGHSISISFDDPAQDNNYYFWRFRSFENLVLCEVCQNGIFRNGACETNPPEGPGVPKREPYYTYGCETACWRIRYNESIEIFDDEFTNGNSILDLPVADVLLFTAEDVLVSVDQLSLSYDAYQYYKRLKDVIDNKGNFNAPPPAAVSGNIFNLKNDNEVVLGRFTATSTSTASIFIDRSDIIKGEIEPEASFSFEGPPAIGSPFTSAPCLEGRFRTGIEPEGWIEN